MFGTHSGEIAHKQQDSETADSTLRNQCIIMALQTCHTTDKTYGEIIEAAQGYYDFITGQRQKRLDEMRNF